MGGEHGDLLRPEAAGGARRVEGGGAVADHGDVVGEPHLAALAHLAQHVEGLDRGIAARDRRARALPGAHAEDDGVEAGVEQTLDGDLVPEGRVVDEACAGVPQRLQLCLEYLLRQAELGDAVAQRAAGLVVGVVDGDLVARLGEVPGGGETGRTGADHGDAPAARHAGDERRRAVVGGRPVQGADGDRFVDLATPALGLAGPRADAPQDAREGQVAAQDPRRRGRVTLFERRHVGGDVDVRRAGVRAGCLAVRVVVGEVHLQVALATRPHALRVGLDLHPLAYPGRAGGLQLVAALDLDKTEAAGAPGGHALLVAEGGDVDAVAAGDVEDGLARLGAQLPAVDREADGGLGPRAHCCLPSTVTGAAASTRTASKRHT